MKTFLQREEVSTGKRCHFLASEEARFCSEWLLTLLVIKHRNEDGSELTFLQSIHVSRIKHWTLMEVYTLAVSSILIATFLPACRYFFVKPVENKTELVPPMRCKGHYFTLWAKLGNVTNLAAWGYFMLSHTSEGAKEQVTVWMFKTRGQ